MTRLAGLPRIAPEEHTLRGALLMSLNGVHVADFVLRAAVLPALSRDACWFRCLGGACFAIERWSGETARFLPRDGVLAAEWLERAEPAVAAIEDALGIELEPAELVGDTTPANCLVLCIEGLAKGEIIHRILLAMPRDGRVRTNPAPFAPELLGDVAMEVDLVLEGPRLVPHEAADLACGDLVLLGGGRLRAHLHMRSRAPLRGHFDPRSLRFHPIPHDRSTP